MLSKHQQIQHELRDALKTAFGDCDNGESLPPVHDLASKDIPYLDAFIHEMLRIANTSGSVVRRATTDTTVLGCSVPAGTELVLNTRVIKTPISVDETLRSITCREAQTKRPRGGVEGPSGQNLEAFDPRRWLYSDTEGMDVFDPEALPTLLFSHGTRGCFGKLSRDPCLHMPSGPFIQRLTEDNQGKRLAMLNLRVFIVILVFSFKFMPIPESKDDWSADEAIFRSPKQCLVKLSVCDQ